MSKLPLDKSPAERVVRSAKDEMVLSISAQATCAQAGTAEIVPLPVWERYFLVAVVFPAYLVQAGVEFP